MSAIGRALSGCQIFDGEALPAGWTCVPLGDRINLAYGVGLPEALRKSGDIAVYGSNGVVGSHQKPLVDGPGILIGRKGTVGAVHFATGPFWPIDTVYYVLTLTGDCLRFLYHLLNYLPLKFLNAATGVPGLSRRDVYALRGAFPPLSEQATIAHILDTVDTAIERTRETIERVQVLRETVLEEMFCNLEAESRCLAEFITDVRYGTSEASNDKSQGNPVLRIPNVVGDQLLLDDLAFAELSPSYVERLRLEDGDILLVRTNGNPNYVGRSVVFLKPDNRAWVYASYLIRVRLKDELLPDFVNTYLGLEPGRRQLLRLVTTSAGNHNINSNSIRLIRLPVPSSPDDQQRVAELAKSFRRRCDALTAKANALQSLKNSLMHDLLTGKVRLRDLIEAPLP